METITVSTFRETLKKSLQKIADNHELMVVKRQRGEDLAVLFLGDFNAMQATLYPLSSASNTAHLFRSKQQLEQGFSQQAPISALTA